jgi:hypothetical protein
MPPAIIIVSGLPRSGTSLMMQMLDRGGVEVVTDKIRSADTDNPRGYYEFEPVKAIKRDAGWLPTARGKAVKMISQLLYDLPPTETYRIVFMERDLDEVLLSQEKMLARLGSTPAPREKIRQAYTIHLQRLHEWLHRQGNLTVLPLPYKALVECPRQQGERLSAFLDGLVDVEQMVQAVDPALYRNRRTAGAP